MNVRVLLFAAARELAGTAQIELELAEAATIGQLRRRLAEEFPRLGGLLPQVMFAVDAAYARDEDPLRPNCEIACIPPVSGG